MTRTRKRRSFNHNGQKAKALKVIHYCLILFLLLFYLPFYLAKHFTVYPAITLISFYSFNCLAGYFLFRSYLKKKNFLLRKQADLRENINILNNQIVLENRNAVSLKEKIRRYSSLKGIIEEINQNLSLDSVTSSLTNVCFSLIANGKGSCILYLINPDNQKLSLYKTKKEDKKLVIKAKEGDVFDYWVLRHISPLHIEDIKKDFRFDLDEIKQYHPRQIASLISAPLVSEHEFIGILRLDNAGSGFYNQDDLRLLVTTSELGVIAIENARLFRKTQDLAIHDGLTKLFTKGYFLDRLKQECKRSFRQSEKLSLLMLDIDYFKNYNDKFGHAAGDMVLSTIAEAINDFLGDLNPVVGRFGGEEFCIILQNVDKQRATTIAKGLLAKIENTKITLRRQETNITISIGVASFPEDATGEDELIFKADRAMYEAKQTGRNKVVNA